MPVQAASVEMSTLFDGNGRNCVVPNQSLPLKKKLPMALKTTGTPDCTFDARLPLVKIGVSRWRLKGTFNLGRK
jgi:hypothetical protein